MLTGEQIHGIILYVLKITAWVWRSLVACLNGVQEAGSSNLLTQTSKRLQNRFFFCTFGLIFVYYGWNSCRIAHDFVSNTDSVASELLRLFLPENRIFAYFHAVSGGNGVITGL